MSYYSYFTSANPLATAYQPFEAEYTVTNVRSQSFDGIECVTLYTDAE